MKGLREHMTALGYPMDDLTDAQIEEGVVRLSKALCRAFTTATEGIEALGRAAHNAGISLGELKSMGEKL